MKGTASVLRRELNSYFATPVAYVFIAIFLILSGVFTFYVGRFFERGQADLLAFFNYLPWLYLVLVPAVAMRLWSEERRSGTIELLLTLPITLGGAVLGKFLAAWLFVGLALALTFPLWLTVNYLGEPDNGVILASYLGGWFMAGGFLAIGSALSALTRNQVIAFVLTLVVGFLFVVAGFPIVQDAFDNWAPLWLIDGLAALSFLTHFNGIARGVIDIRDLLFFALTILAWLWITVLVLQSRRRAPTALASGGVLLGFLALALLVSLGLPGSRLDLTENRLYTLSDGTREVLASLEEPLELTFYFSDQQTRELPGLRMYANRVRELLEEYAARSDGMIRLREVDPEPFSEAEDKATLAGLEGVPAGRAGDPVFFGLVGESPAGDQAVIPFFQMHQEQRLEYDITQLIHNLAHPEPPVIGIISGLPVEGGGMPHMPGGQSEPWAFLQQVEDLFEVRWLPSGIEQIDEAVDVLLLIHPVGLTELDRFAIDQYLLRGGRAVMFLDPHAETAAGASNHLTGPVPPRSALPELLEHWGLSLSPEFVADYDNSLVVSVGPEQKPSRHIGLLGLGPEAMRDEFLPLAGLERLNLASAGALSLTEDSPLTLTPLLQSSSQAQLMDTERLQQLRDPAGLLDDFEPTGQAYTLAARVQGRVGTAFPDGITIEEPAEDEAGEAGEEAPEEPKTRQLQPEHREGELELVLVADTDVLSDRLWVQVERFFGQRIMTPWADNGAMLVNTLDFYAGSEALINVRSRGQYQRPFTRIEAMRAEAESRLLDRQRELQKRLEETEQRLSELEAQRGQGDQEMLTEEQRETLARFQEEKVAIRKDLRDVQHSLNAAIDALKAKVKVLNILVLPLLLTLLLALAHWAWRRLGRL